ncbi:dioxygenase family protein [Limnoglobus roseus]|uniref:Intradiol ring-cleavage dioxygenase n=1 Tax=Limnoglobus roseus TaxID=2598579 RepID=A0A5C1AHB0_9BACT|nr:protocatechuate 3,4-dioxygenase [Limnoglobus roseus]QEL18015.1 intradiol ring-cleavage dioxygenase [Limnoglobus roseus]
MRESFFNRRAFLRGGAALGAAALWTPGVFAEQLLRTPSLTEGPFYPDKLPLDTDNDLLVINDSITPAVGEITHLTGKVLGPTGSPIKDAVVEIWQCDAKQVYLHTSDSGPKAKQQDKNFQGFGRFTTGSTGEYRFRTIKPVAYPGRPAPHIHVKVKKGDRELLTTQFMVRGHAGNARDGVFNGTRDLIDRELILVDFKPIKESKVGELSANFVIVLGRTPDDRDTQPTRTRGR